MNRDPDFLRAEALAPTDSIALPVASAADSQLPNSVPPPMAAQVAVLVGFAHGGAVPLVLGTGEATAWHAETLLPLGAEDIGRRVAVMPLHGAGADWLVIGLLAGQTRSPAGVPAPGSAVEVQADGRRLTLQAREEMVLRCGKASLKLRADGRVELRGETIVSEAMRANRVRGGSVELN